MAKFCAIVLVDLECLMGIRKIESLPYCVYLGRHLPAERSRPGGPNYHRVPVQPSETYAFGPLSLASNLFVYVDFENSM